MISPKTVREIILRQSKRANVGHIGSALSVVEILSVLFSDILSIPSHHDPERDRFVLSKGHAALALYAVMHLKGWISQEKLNTYCADASMLGVHPEYGLPGIDFATGSLGMGHSFGAGAALAAQLGKSSRRIFVLASDAECNSGVVWEAAMFAAQHKLGNLCVVLDANGQQALDYTKNVLDLSPLADRWKAFGWDVHEIEGHNEEKLKNCFRNLDYRRGKPHFVLAKTTFGKGVSYMENSIKWHYWPMSDKEFEQALAEVGNNL